jgi:hypothetical protein
VRLPLSIWNIAGVREPFLQIKIVISPAWTRINIDKQRSTVNEKPYLTKFYCEV